MSKKFYILLLVLLGFLMTPSVAFACGTKMETSCCDKKASKTSQKDCCKKEKKSNESSHDGCNGACKSISCGSSVMHLGLTAVFNAELNKQIFVFSAEKQNYYYSEIFISSHFRSIWLPPKIG